MDDCIIGPRRFLDESIVHEAIVNPGKVAIVLNRETSFA